MRMLFLAAALVLAGGPATAQDGFRYEWKSAETRFGSVTVETTKDSSGFEGAEGVFVDGVSVPGFENWRYWIEGAEQVGEDDVVLLYASSGGNEVCTHHVQLLILRLGRTPAASPPFAWCPADLKDVRNYGTRLEIDVAVTDPRLSHVAAVYAQGRVAEVAVPMRETAAPMPGGGTAVTRWEGAHPYEILEDPGERQRFLALMPQEKLFQLQERVSVASGAEIRDGWLIATGCMPHQCGIEGGAFAIEIATGRAEAVIFHASGGTERFSEAKGLLHQDLEAFARNGGL